ncbi:hypothetical protein BB560_005775 [Smittium megazygosporum]|uniref:Hexosyltransferase n=1 Tax=Smittium megazygosporum TaxID=133381 RepID=A0A2T9YXC7_9FUNG|nr:hypothetical protein BB560_005775 [Smittium megazygosporum]
MIKTNRWGLMVVIICCVLLLMNISKLRDIRISLKGIQNLQADTNSMKVNNLERLIVPARRLKIGNRIKMPRKGTAGKMWEIKDLYHIMVPMSDIEDISYFKSFYNDLEMEVICDGNNRRDGCDSYLEDEYVYDTLREKTRDMFQRYCESGQKHKVIAKMDCDTIIIDKEYFYKVIKFMADNGDKPMYYGNPLYRDYGGISMGGNFYAINEKAIEHLCSCKMEISDVSAEDLWFGDVMNNCTISKNLQGINRINYIFNDGRKILHKNYNAKGVSLELGRNINNDEESY